MRRAMSSGTPSFFRRLAMALAMMAGVRSALARSSQFSLGLGGSTRRRRGRRHRLLELADHVGPHVGAPVVQLFLELVLDDLALLLDDQDLLQAQRELAGDVGLQRPHHVDLVQADAQLVAGGLVQAQVGQGLAGVVEGLAAGDDAEAVVRPSMTLWLSLLART
jgi:hypothetical protein